MNPWPFVIAAYCVCLILTSTLVVLSIVSMRRAEAAADALNRR